jgi:hypothetical protein
VPLVVPLASSRIPGGLLLFVLLGCGACKVGEDLWRLDAEAPSVGDAVDMQTAGVGSTCDVLAVVGPTTGIYNAEALECPSLICLKPAVRTGALEPADTTALCSAFCTQDSDCTGETRDAGDPLDTRCRTGFLCGIPFTKGRICCQKLCLCRDFLGPEGAPSPIACQGDAAATCME